MQFYCHKICIIKLFDMRLSRSLCWSASCLFSCVVHVRGTGKGFSKKDVLHFKEAILLTVRMRRDNVAVKTYYLGSPYA